MIGDLVEDVVVWTAGPTRPGTDNPASIHRTRGGSAANTAALAASEVPTRFLGRIGTDRVGVALVDELAAAGVEVRVERAGRTGTVVVLVDGDGERTMFPDRAASRELAHVPDAWLSDTAVLHAPAYGLADEPMASAILSAAERVHAIGGAVSVDLSARSLLEDLGVERVRALLARLAPDVVFANAEEAAAADLGSMAPAGVFVVKHGARPARVVAADPRRPDRPADELDWVEVPAVEVDGVRDTTGAGDAFTAGFLPAWMRGAAIEDACRAGHRRAAAILRTPGAIAPAVRVPRPSGPAVVPRARHRH